MLAALLPTLLRALLAPDERWAARGGVSTFDAAGSDAGCSYLHTRRVQRPRAASRQASLACRKIQLSPRLQVPLLKSRQSSALATLDLALTTGQLAPLARPFVENWQVSSLCPCILRAAASWPGTRGSEALGLSEASERRTSMSRP